MMDPNIKVPDLHLKKVDLASDVTDRKSVERTEFQLNHDKLSNEYIY